MSNNIADEVLRASREQINKIIPINIVREKIKEHQHKIGTVNIIVAGKTGVGKTSLINAVFGEAVGKTGAGRPVTQDIEWFEHSGLPIRLCDTKGLEMQDFEITLGNVEKEIIKCEAHGEALKRIHIAWICILEASSRIEAGEQLLVEICNKHKIPTIVTLTKSSNDDEFADKVVEILPTIDSVIPVNLRGPQPFGLEKLVTRTYQLVPDAAKKAFAAAQQIDIDKKRSSALTIVSSAAVSAGAAAFTPIPMAATGVILTINIGMLAGISVAMGIVITDRSPIPLAVGLVGILASLGRGRLILGEALKFIPGVGSIPGGLLEASVAATTTYTVGRAFTEFLIWFFGQNQRMPIADEIAEEFFKYWNRHDPKEFAPDNNQFDKI